MIRRLHDLVAVVVDAHCSSPDRRHFQSRSGSVRSAGASRDCRSFPRRRRAAGVTGIGTAERQLAGIPRRRLRRVAVQRLDRRSRAAASCARLRAAPDPSRECVRPPDRLSMTTAASLLPARPSSPGRSRRNCSLRRTTDHGHRAGACPWCRWPCAPRASRCCSSPFSPSSPLPAASAPGSRNSGSRCMSVTDALDHVPCRSGAPQHVFGGAYPKATPCAEAALLRQESAPRRKRTQTRGACASASPFRRLHPPLGRAATLPSPWRRAIPAGARFCAGQVRQTRLGASRTAWISRYARRCFRPSRYLLHRRNRLVDRIEHGTAEM